MGFQASLLLLLVLTCQELQTQSEKGRGSFHYPSPSISLQVGEEAELILSLQGCCLKCYHNKGGWSPRTPVQLVYAGIKPRGSIGKKNDEVWDLHSFGQLLKMESSTSVGWKGEGRGTAATPASLLCSGSSQPLTKGFGPGEGEGLAALNCFLSVDPSICNLPLEKGSCRAGLYRWYYKMEENQCEPFLYGGCEGNDNRFREKILCEEACKTT
ncbi:uncharacterized protein LOC107160189 [Marmota marmota marmota]|uniref:uncharacterized protein LOC107160189 n=1 Tax=Marmota marmota marmota TaxID=9994 RepID=UPI002092723A|nr:uncharacterized protein LOC107160189 [Marmota marmota marmota]